MRKKRPKHTKTQQKVDKSRKLKENGRNTPKRIKTQTQVQKGKKWKETTKVHRNVQLFTTQNPCVFLRVVQLLPHRILMFSKGWCSSYPTLCFPKGGVAVTTQNPCIFPRVVQVLPHRILFSSEWYTAFAACAAFSLRQKLCPPQVFTRILYVKGYAPLRFLQGFCM